MRQLKWKVPLYPITPIVAIVAVLVAFIGQFFVGSGQTIGPIPIPGTGLTVVVGLIWTAFWTLYYFAIGSKFSHAQAWRDQQRRATRRRTSCQLPRDR